MMNNINNSNNTHAGQAVYTPLVLQLYNLIVLTLSNRFAWRCPTKIQLKNYNDNITDCHLDVGVGSGYYLNHCIFPTKKPTLTLIDSNKNCLRYCHRLLVRYKPSIIQADLYDLPPLIQSFDSIGLNYVLHCLPGNLQTKSTVIQQLLPLLSENGVLFGATILNTGENPNFMARKLLNIYNKKGIFSNQFDDVASLKEMLNLYFKEVKINTVGMVAIFSAKHKYEQIT